MSQKPQSAQLLIEWDREWVRVHFVESSTTKEGISLEAIEGVNGKTAVLLLSRRLILQRSIALPDAQKSDVLVALKMKLVDVFPIPASPESRTIRGEPAAAASSAARISAHSFSRPTMATRREIAGLVTPGPPHA